MVEDLDLIKDYHMLKIRKNIVCGSKEYVRKASRLLVRENISIERIYCDDEVMDEELQKIEKASFTNIDILKEKEAYNIIYAEKNQDLFDENLKWIDSNSRGHIYTYCGLYIALSINAKNKKQNSSEMICMNELNATMGIYDFFAKWLRGIRWVEESGINLILYAMPKTGTQAMKATLNKYGIEHTYVHFLNLYFSFSKQFYSFFSNRVTCMADLINNTEYIKHNYLKVIKGKKVKIITSIREPIARNYSAIFQAIKNWGPYPLVSDSNGDFAQGIINYLGHCCDSTWEWFDAEIKEIFDIDVFQYPFDKEKGYIVIKKNNIEVFLYRLESSGHLGKALGEFLDATENIDMLVCHETDKEEFRFIYNQLKEELHVPETILSKSYDNDKMRHFYTEEEISWFIDKWK